MNIVFNFESCYQIVINLYYKIIIDIILYTVYILCYIIHIIEI